MKTIFPVLSALLTLCLSDVATAVPVQWSGNNHWYELAGSVGSWSEANQLAGNSVYNGMAGHLATIGSANESSFLTSQFKFEHAFIGGRQQDNAASVTQGWYWVTGETMAYENWNTGEPNDLGDNVENNQENFMFMYGSERGAEAGTWNDVYDRFSSLFLIEYESVSIPAPPVLLLAGPAAFVLLALKKRGRRCRN